MRGAVLRPRLPARRLICPSQDPAARGNARGGAKLGRGLRARARWGLWSELGEV